MEKVNKVKTTTKCEKRKNPHTQNTNKIYNND